MPMLAACIHKKLLVIFVHTMECWILFQLNLINSYVLLKSKVELNFCFSVCYAFPVILWRFESFLIALGCIYFSQICLLFFTLFSRYANLALQLFSLLHQLIYSDFFVLSFLMLRPFSCTLCCCVFFPLFFFVYRFKLEKWQECKWQIPK